MFAQVPPRVEYQLTALGLSLLVPLSLLREWAEENVPSILEAREDYDEARDAEVLEGRSV